MAKSKQYDRGQNLGKYLHPSNGTSTPNDKIFRKSPAPSPNDKGFTKKPIPEKERGQKETGQAPSGKGIRWPYIPNPYDKHGR